MTWGEPIAFGRQVGKVTTTEFRLAVVKNGDKLGMCLVIPGVSAKALRWTTETAVALLPGQGEHHGWLRLIQSKDPGARRLRATGKSQNLRLVTPLWPWLEGRITEYRALEVVESVLHVGIVDLLLPAWAEPPGGAPVRDPDQREPPTPPPAQEGRARRLLEGVPHPSPPNLPPRQGEPPRERA
jgi:hypothetical protein